MSASFATPPCPPYRRNCKKSSLTSFPSAPTWPTTMRPCNPSYPSSMPPGSRASRPVSTVWMPTYTPLRNFVLPGGHPLVSHAHIARTVCRRAERLVHQLEGELRETALPLPTEILPFLNRLSDYFFTLSRWFCTGSEGGRNPLETNCLIPFQKELV